MFTKQLCNCLWRNRQIHKYSDYRTFCDSTCQHSSESFQVIHLRKSFKSTPAVKLQVFVFIESVVVVEQILKNMFTNTREHLVNMKET